MFEIAKKEIKQLQELGFCMCFKGKGGPRNMLFFEKKAKAKGVFFGKSKSKSVFLAFLRGKAKAKRKKQKQPF